VILRCKVDGLLLEAGVDPHTGRVTCHDGDEAFELEAVEALYYRLLTATEAEALAVEASYRLLRRADDFFLAPPGGTPYLHLAPV
jgi:hypothetical protein